MKNFIKNYKVEIIIFLIAIILIFFNPDKAILGIKYAVKTFLYLLPIIVSVAYLTGFISEIIPKQTIKKFVGKESGFKGKLLGGIFGTLMIGPAYAFYPFFAELINNGANIGVIAVTIAAWSIKIQWLPFALSILDIKFVLLLNLFIIIYAFSSGYIMELFFKSKKL
ncbi:hypothetical protein [Marinitoga aeolica]|uniref:Permease n=1 Tax=Marinitoga aeolica TaxID=2809031 RepID=A0ABY8PN63_9BACT|nr:hypothetical protein [Marinitoga aeolica]WGS64086.1 hypothetical protein JRV97_06795 [Marinitoga aeolica]